MFHYFNEKSSLFKVSVVHSTVIAFGDEPKVRGHAEEEFGETGAVLNVGVR
jgi:hypothetical protein